MARAYNSDHDDEPPVVVRTAMVKDNAIIDKIFEVSSPRADMDHAQDLLKKQVSLDSKERIADDVIAQVEHNHEKLLKIHISHYLAMKPMCKSFPTVIESYMEGKEFKQVDRKGNIVAPKNPAQTPNLDNLKFLAFCLRTSQKKDFTQKDLFKHVTEIIYLYL